MNDKMTPQKAATLLEADKQQRMQAVDTAVHDTLLDYCCASCSYLAHFNRWPDCRYYTDRGEIRGIIATGDRRKGRSSWGWPPFWFMLPAGRGIAPMLVRSSHVDAIQTIPGGKGKMYAFAWRSPAMPRNGRYKRGVGQGGRIDDVQLPLTWRLTAGTSAPIMTTRVAI